MLRFIVLALLLANGVYFAWSHSLLVTLGLGPVQQTEPQRMGQQIKPEALRILTPQELRLATLEAQPPAPAVPLKPTECRQAGVFTEPQSALLRSQLESRLPAGSWVLSPAVEPAHWIVYMGKYASAQELARKRAQLAVLNLKFEPLTNPALALGLSLGRYETQAAATAALAGFSQRGVRTARVVQEQAEVSGLMLRVPAVDDVIRVHLTELAPVLAGKPLVACR